MFFQKFDSRDTRPELFIDREGDQRWLRQNIEAALSNRDSIAGRSICVHGPKGSGKTTFDAWSSVAMSRLTHWRGESGLLGFRSLTEAMVNLAAIKVDEALDSAAALEDNARLANVDAQIAALR